MILIGLMGYGLLIGRDYWPVFETLRSKIYTKQSKNNLGYNFRYWWVSATNFQETDYALHIKIQI